MTEDDVEAEVNSLMALTLGVLEGSGFDVRVDPEPPPPNARPTPESTQNPQYKTRLEYEIRIEELKEELENWLRALKVTGEKRSQVSLVAWKCICGRINGFQQGTKRARKVCEKCKKVRVGKTLMEEILGQLGD